MSHVCDGCGESFETLTRLRLHEKDDCQGRATFGRIDPLADDVGQRGAEELATCRECGAQAPPDADFENTTDYDGEDFHYITEFTCRNCGFDNENRLVMTGVNEEDLTKLPSHLRPDAVGGEA